jgi:hypothetical protein
MKDWTGNKAATFICLGASNHAEHDRAEYDYYATDPKAAELLLGVESELNNIWECACGEGHLAKVFNQANKLGLATDLIYRGYGNLNPIDFLTWDDCWEGDIVTNPPYKYAKEFVEKALEILEDGKKVAMFLKLTFLEGAKRKELFEKNPPKFIYVFRKRVDCWKNGIKPDKPSRAVCYAWFVWEKGFKGDPVVRWIN